MQIQPVTSHSSTTTLMTTFQKNIHTSLLSDKKEGYSSHFFFGVHSSKSIALEKSKDLGIRPDSPALNGWTICKTFDKTWSCVVVIHVCTTTSPS